MNLDILQNVDFKRNRYLRAGTQLLTVPPSDPVLGESLFFNVGAPSPLQFGVWDGNLSEGTPSSGWRLMSGSNRNDIATGLWTWNPTHRGVGTLPGERAPFLLGVESNFDTGNIQSNRVTNLNADLLDGRHTQEWVDAPPGQALVPVYGSSGRLAVGDPVTDYDAVNRKTLLAASSGLIALAPCRAASTVRFAGGRAGNVLTATGPGAFVPDGVAVIVGDRVLIKDQQTGGSGIDNGIYTVTVVGNTVPGAQAVLTRATDADATGELVVGALVYIDEGTTNRATQWSCQRPTGTGGGSAIVINTDIMLWQKTFQQSAYTAGRGMALAGLEFNFCQAADYVKGQIFTASDLRIVSPIAPPSAGVVKFLQHTGTPGQLPLWGDVQISTISDWPFPMLPGSPRTAKRHARFGTDTKTVEDSQLEDGTGVVLCPTNTVLAPTVTLGDVTHPFGNVWTSALRLKRTAGASTTALLLGTQDDAADPNTDHKAVVTWTASQVKAWIGVTVTDVGGVPASRTLWFLGGEGILWSPTASQDLSSNRTWIVELDYPVLDARWVTVTGAQDILDLKRWRSPSASDNMVEFYVAADGPPLSGTNYPSLRITAGGSVQWGDGSAAPAGGIQYNAGFVQAYGKPFEFAASAPVRLQSATNPGGAPSFLLGLESDNDIRKVTAADIAAFTGLPALAQNAVGYGDATGRLAGDATKLRWDYTANRLGINVTPANTLDVAGNMRVANTLATSAPAVSYPGALITVSDTSTLQTDWTNRFLYGAYVVAGKTGTALFGTSATIEAVVAHSQLAAGSVVDIRALRATTQIGAASSGPSVTNAYGVYSGFASAAGAAGTIGTFYHFYGTNIPANMPQPAEVYGIQLGDYTSLAGATRTAGCKLDMSITGVGQRYNIYSPGNAPSYFAGPIGLGVTLSPPVASPPANVTPTARLEFAVGTTILAPMRFAAASALSSLISAQLPGHFESRGDRLMFTDTNSVRHPLAYFDDTAFTNDSGASPAGAVAFDYNAHMVATLDTVNAIGQNDFTLWARFKVPTALRGPTQEGVCSVAGGNTLATSMNVAARIYLTVGGLISFVLSTDGNNWRAMRTAAGAFAIYGGKVIDVVCVRKGSAQPIMYINGVAQGTLAETTLGTVPAWDMAVTSSYLHAGSDFTNYGSVPEIYRVAFFNYGMTATEAADVSRLGHVDVADKWGQMTNIAMTNPGFETFAAGVPTGWTKGAAAGMTTTDETVDFHGGLHACRFTGGGPASATTSNWLYQPCLVSEKRHWLRAWVKRVSGTGALNFGNAFQLQSSIGVNTTSAATWTQITVQGKCGSAYGNQYSLTFAAVAGEVWLLDDVTAQQVGAVADMNFAVGCGAIIPDNSGRYPGTMTGGYDHVVSTCPSEVVVGSGDATHGVPSVARNLRRFTQTIQVIDGAVLLVTHNLGTTNLTVAVWNAAGASVAVAVNTKSGNTTNAVELAFALVGAPSTAVTFTVVIIG